MRGVKGGTQSGLSEEKEWKVWKESLCVCCVWWGRRICVYVCGGGGVLKGEVGLILGCKVNK